MFKKLVNEKVLEVSEYSLKTWNIKVNPNIEYNIKSVRVLGTYNLKSDTMDLNISLLEEFGELYINEVVVHELAHLIVDALYPSRMNYGKKVMPHGKEFKVVCAHLNIPGKSTCDLFKNSKHLQPKKRKTVRYGHKCDCMVHHITKNMHNKMINGARYTCKDCNSFLSSEGELIIK